MRVTDTADLWWKSAVVYCLDVQTFKDGNGDGMGDFVGLSQHVDYLADLGVTCLWLMPFQPSADRDDGYDVTDYYGVDPRVGTLGDVVEFLRTAHDRGLRVICDLVVNHTSVQHPWFQQARADRESPLRDWYVWRDEPPDGPNEPVFPDAESSVWSFDEVAGQWYLHHFYRQMPDLNVTNPRVRDEIAKVMGFWLELGMDGFRVDAVPYLLETAGVDRGVEKMPDPHDFLRRMRAFLSRRRGDAVLLGEVNLPYAEIRRYFGDEDGDELTMAFDFPGMQAMYLAFARADAGPLRAALQARPTPPRDGHWATFVRNHDELTLDKLSGAERQEVFAAFGPEESMQLFGRGLRRRLPPMVGNDRRRLRLAYSLLLSLPGTPVLFYGEEIGLGENLDLPGRLAVRTPMQWAPLPDGGFSAGLSTAATVEPFRPMPDGPFGPARISVAAQRSDPDSLLSWVRRAVRRYRECPELAWGAVEILDHEEASVLVVCARWEAGTVLVAHNLGARERSVQVAVPELDGRWLVDLLDGTPARRVAAGGAVTFDLDGYGTGWWRAVDNRHGFVPGSVS